MNELLNFIAQREGEAINFHRELVRRPAINPEHGGEGEEIKARWIEEWLYQNGLCRVQRMDALDVQANNKLRPNLVAHFLPAGCKHTLWLVTHMDIAAPGPLEHWMSDPFILRIDGDRLYGRGVEDNNQGIVSALLLLDAIKQLKITPPMGIGIIFTSASIIDYTKGISHVLNKIPQLFRADDLIVAPDYGNENGSIIEIGEKCNAWVRIDVKGRAYHAGFSEGPNCFEAAARFISRLKHVRRRYACPDPFFFPPTSTITPTHSETNSTGLNHVPANFVFYLDIRLMPNCRLESVMNDLQQLARLIEKQERVLFTFSPIEITPEAPITSGHSPVIRILSDAIEKELSVTPRLVGVGGVTMVSVIRSLGLPVAVWGIQQSSKNQVNESISLKAQLEQTRIFARMLYTSPLKLSKMMPPQSIPCVGAKNITPAEQSVARLVGLGMSNENMGEQLNLSVNTIRTHLKNLYRKTGASNRRELQRLFILK
ncbi:M20 family metallo-hydrolase [Pectobacterium versatile]|nr:M20 family metallo-hydrolase [Pectobacterium versatile]